MLGNGVNIRMLGVPDFEFTRLVLPISTHSNSVEAISFISFLLLAFFDGEEP